MISGYVKLLSEPDLEQIHEKSLFLLENCGITISHERALELLKEAGARVDFATDRVYIPRNLVEQCVARTPKRCTLGAMNLNHRIELPHPEGGFYTRSGTGSLGYIDLHTNQFRNTTMADTSDWIRVVDALENIDICTVPSPGDVCAKNKDLYAIKCALENTGKHIMIQPYSDETLVSCAEMGALVAGGKSQFKDNPIISMVCCSTSPLSYKFMDVEIIFVAGKYGIPLHIASLNSPGGTSPNTIAGSIVLANAEILAGIVLTQIISPGTAIIGVSQSLPLNMVTGNALQATVEAALADAAGVQVIKDLYHLPTRTYGFSTDALFSNGQSMIERTFFAVLMALNGTDILSHAGQLEASRTISIPQLVIDDDISGMLRRLMRGIRLDDDELAVEVISEAAAKGDFLQHYHTLKHCRDVYRPATFFRNGRTSMQSEESKDILQRAREKAVNILTQRKKYLSDAMVADLAQIINDSQ